MVLRVSCKKYSVGWRDLKRSIQTGTLGEPQVTQLMSTNLRARVSISYFYYSDVRWSFEASCIQF
jgi:hypothetical protein